MVTKQNVSVLTDREPKEGAAGGRPSRMISNRGFLVPDAAMPGPLTRFAPVDADEEGSAGGDSVGDHESQNQDRI